LAAEARSKDRSKLFDAFEFQAQQRVAVLERVSSPVPLSFSIRSARAFKPCAWMFAQAPFNWCAALANATRLIARPRRPCRQLLLAARDERDRQFLCKCTIAIGNGLKSRRSTVASGLPPAQTAAWPRRSRPHSFPSHIL